MGGFSSLLTAPQHGRNCSLLFLLPYAFKSLDRSCKKIIQPSTSSSLQRTQYSPIVGLCKIILSFINLLKEKTTTTNQQPKQNKKPKTPPPHSPTPSKTTTNQPTKNTPNKNMCFFLNGLITNWNTGTELAVINLILLVGAGTR